MADDFDRAQELDGLAVESARNLQAQKAASEQKLIPCGECYNQMCGEPLEAPRLFCGPKCATAYARRN